MHKLEDVCLLGHAVCVHVLESGKVAEYVEEHIVQKVVLLNVVEQRYPFVRMDSIRQLLVVVKETT